MHTELNNFKGFLLDIDNTLYEYEPAHKAGLQGLSDLAANEFDISHDAALDAYRSARAELHFELKSTASSHNRFLFIQRLLEYLGQNSLVHAHRLYDAYWDAFLEAMQPAEGVYEFLDLLVAEKKEVCFISDLSAFVQCRKIQRLKLEKYASLLVTSEEAGYDKPHPWIFQLGLKKLDLAAGDVCMIGDHYEKDIEGAMNCGIRAFWVNRDGADGKDNGARVVGSFREFL